MICWFHGFNVQEPKTVLSNTGSSECQTLVAGIWKAEPFDTWSVSQIELYKIGNTTTWMVIKQQAFDYRWFVNLITLDYLNTGLRKTDILYFTIWK